MKQVFIDHDGVQVGDSRGYINLEPQSGEPVRIVLFDDRFHDVEVDPELVGGYAWEGGKEVSPGVVVGAKWVYSQERFDANEAKKLEVAATVLAELKAAQLAELNALRTVASFQGYSDQAKALMISDITTGTAARFNAIKAAMLANWETKAQRQAVWSQVPDAAGLTPGQVFDIIEAKNAIVVGGA